MKLLPKAKSLKKKDFQYIERRISVSKNKNDKNKNKGLIKQNRVRLGRKWAQQKELQSRKHSNIQPVYDRITSSKVFKMDDLKQYIRSVSATHTRLVTSFMFSNIY